MNMYEYKGVKLNIPEKLLEKYLYATGLPLNDTDINAFLCDAGYNDFSSKEDKEQAIISALQTELQLWG